MRLGKVALVPDPLKLPLFGNPALGVAVNTQGIPEGKPFKETEPTLEAQVGCTTCCTTGEAGFVGFMIFTCTAAERHESITRVTVKVQVPTPSPQIV